MSVASVTSQSIDAFLARLTTAPSLGSLVRQQSTLLPGTLPDQALPAFLPSWLTTLASTQGIAHLTEAQRQGFDSLSAALAQQGQRLEELLGDVKAVVVQTHSAVLDLQGQVKGQGDQLREIGQAVQKMLEEHQDAALSAQVRTRAEFVRKVCLSLDIAADDLNCEKAAEAA